MTTNSLNIDIIALIIQATNIHDVVTLLSYKLHYKLYIKYTLICYHIVHIPLCTASTIYNWQYIWEVYIHDMGTLWSYKLHLLECINYI